MTRRAAPLLLLALVAAAAPPFAAAQERAEPPGAGALTWERCEAAGMRIRAVRIVTEDVFDLSRPDEGHAVGRAANFIHVTTREQVVRAALLLAPGDPVRTANVRESERRLRALPWLIDASIEPEAAGPGEVDAAVRTHDGWSLSLGAKLNRAGGDTTWAVRVDERNLLGLGKELLVSRERDLDRMTTEFAYADPLLLGSSWRLAASWADLSDGSGERVLLERPFVQLSTPWSAWVEAASRDLVEKQYDRGDQVYAFPATLAKARAGAGRLVRLAGRTAWRAGLEFRAEGASYGALDVIAPPGGLPPPLLEDRRLRGLFAELSVSEDRYGTFLNLQSIGHTEDVNLGWEASVKAGWYGRALGGDADAFGAEVSVTRGFTPGDDLLLLLAADGRARGGDGGWRDAFAHARVSLYRTGLPWQTLAAVLDAAGGHRLDPEGLLYLGGFDGLRGYPNHWRAGEGRWMIALEDRVVTPWRIWGLAQVGFVGYAEAGAMAAPAGGWTRTLADVGFGLRFGNLKGTVARVVQLTVAVPLVREPGLSSIQVVAGNTLRF